MCKEIFTILIKIVSVSVHVCVYIYIYTDRHKQTHTQVRVYTNKHTHRCAYTQGHIEIMTQMNLKKIKAITFPYHL